MFFVLALYKKGEIIMHNIQYFSYLAKGLDKNSVQAKLSDYVSHQTW